LRVARASSAVGLMHQNNTRLKKILDTAFLAKVLA